jgi:hypothetical protein
VGAIGSENCCAAPGKGSKIRKNVEPSKDNKKSIDVANLRLILFSLFDTAMTPKDRNPKRIISSQL